MRNGNKLEIQPTESITLTLTNTEVNVDHDIVIGSCLGDPSIAALMGASISMTTDNIKVVGISQLIALNKRLIARGAVANIEMITSDSTAGKQQRAVRPQTIEAPLQSEDIRLVTQRANTFDPEKNAVVLLKEPIAMSDGSGATFKLLRNQSIDINIVIFAQDAMSLQRNPTATMGAR